MFSTLQPSFTQRRTCARKTEEHVDHSGAFRTRFTLIPRNGKAFVVPLDLSGLGAAQTETYRCSFAHTHGSPKGHIRCSIHRPVQPPHLCQEGRSAQPSLHLIHYHKFADRKSCRNRHIARSFTTLSRTQGLVLRKERLIASTTIRHPETASGKDQPNRYSITANAIIVVTTISIITFFP